MFPIQIAQYLQYCGNLSKVVVTTIFNTDYLILWQLKQNFGKISQTPPPPSSFLKRWDGNFGCDFSVKCGG